MRLVLHRGQREVRVALNVTPPEGDTPGDRFQVDSPATTRTVVDDQAGMARQEFIPHRIQPLDVTNFADSDPIRRISGLPERGWPSVEVLAEASDAPCLDDFREEV